jgi:hypothetical protein
LADEAVHKGLAVSAVAKQFSAACTILQQHLHDHKKMVTHSYSTLIPVQHPL